MEKGHIPFPSSHSAGEGGLTRTNSIDAEMQISVPSSSTDNQSHATTTSSKLTSSDKLTALPTSSSPTPNASRIARTSNFAMHSNVMGKRGFRHSLDSSAPLPGRPNGNEETHMHSSAFSYRKRTDTGRVNDVHRSALRPPGSPDPPSSGQETPRQRVSFDSDRHSQHTTPANGKAFSRITTRGSDPAPSTPHRRTSSDRDSSGEIHRMRSPSPSQSRSRAHSPLRMFQQWSSNLHHRGRTASEERFVPVDPYKFRGRLPFLKFGTPRRDIEHGAKPSAGSTYDCDDLLPVHTFRDALDDTRYFLADTLPREIYLNFLLRLPAMYFSRVARIFENADVSRPEIQRMINNSGGRGGIDQQVSSGAGYTVGGMLAPGIAAGIGMSAQASVAPAATMMHMPLPFPDEWTPPVVSPALIRFKHSWEAFIDSLLREWKTLNLVSALLASAILTIFQIPEAASDPITRTFALVSLVCALMSLSYGCMYIVRFGTMRSMYHASKWAEEARKTNTSIWWNVWVLLATPAVWMAWAMLLFLSAILSFVWRTGSVGDPETRPPLAPNAATVCRIIITSVLFLGIIYFGMIVKTLRSYGAHSPEWHRGIHSPRVGWMHHHRTSNAVDEDKLDGDDGMEQRGRPRERSISTHVRRREADPERQRSDERRSLDHDINSNVKRPKTFAERFGLKASPQTAVVPQLAYAGQGSEIELDLKVSAEMAVGQVH